MSNFQSCDRIIGLFSIGLNLQSFLSPINSLVLFDFSLYCYRSPTYRYRNIGKSNSFLMYQKYFHLWCTPTEYVLKANGMKNVSSSTSWKLLSPKLQNFSYTNWISKVCSASRSNICNITGYMYYKTKKSSFNYNYLDLIRQKNSFLCLHTLYVRYIY